MKLDVKILAIEVLSLPKTVETYSTKWENELSEIMKALVNRKDIISKMTKTGSLTKIGFTKIFMTWSKRWTDHNWK